MSMNFSFSHSVLCAIEHHPTAQTILAVVVISLSDGQTSYQETPYDSLWLRQCAGKWSDCVQISLHGPRARGSSCHVKKKLANTEHLTNIFANLEIR